MERDTARIFRRAPNLEALRELAEPAEREFKNLYRQKKETQLQPRHYHALDLFNGHFWPDRDCRHALQADYKYLSNQLDSYRAKLAGQEPGRPSKKNKRTRSPEQDSGRLPASHPSRLQPPGGPTVDDLLAPDPAEKADTPVNPQAGAFNTPEPASPAPKPDLGPVQTTISVRFPDVSEEQQDQAYSSLTKTAQQLARAYPDRPKPTVRLSYSHDHVCS